MMLLKPKVSSESPRLFDGALMEFLSRTHPVTVAVLYSPIVAYLIWYSLFEAKVGAWITLGLLPLGMMTWTFTEYWIHRAIMHCVPDFSWGEKFHYWAHEIHHKWPSDPYRLVMPLPVSFALFVIFFGAFYFIIGAYALSFHAGFTLAYISYDLIHYWVHHGKSQSRIFKFLQKHHLSHHFTAKYEELRFAVSMPIWDKLFGTNSLKKTAIRPQNQSQITRVSQSESAIIKKVASDDQNRSS